MSGQLPEITTYFMISADFAFDPQDVSARLPIVPTQVEKRGDSRPAPRPAVKDSTWCIECKGRAIQSIDEGIREVLDIVWPHRLAIVKVLTEMNLRSYFVSVVYIHDLGVVYELLPETIRRLTELRAEWNMDLYDFSE